MAFPAFFQRRKVRSGSPSKRPLKKLRLTGERGSRWMRLCEARFPAASRISRCASSGLGQMAMTRAPARRNEAENWPKYMGW